MAFSVPANDEYKKVRGFSPLGSIKVGTATFNTQTKQLLENDKFVQCYSNSSVLNWSGSETISASSRVTLLNTSSYMRAHTSRLRVIVDWGNAAIASPNFHIFLTINFGTSKSTFLTCLYGSGLYGIQSFFWYGSPTDFTEGFGTIKVKIEGTGTINNIQIYEEGLTILP